MGEREEHRTRTGLSGPPDMRAPPPILSVAIGRVSAEPAGEGVGGVAVQAVAGAVVAPGGTRVGVAGEVLDVAERHAGLETARR
jgi:hypothetical protein